MVQEGGNSYFCLDELFLEVHIETVQVYYFDGNFLSVEGVEALVDYAGKTLSDLVVGRIGILSDLDELLWLLIQRNLPRHSFNHLMKYSE